MPDLVMPDAFFYYKNDQDTYIKMWESDDKGMLNLKVHNIGLGVAKDIEFSWHYDVDAMMAIYHRLSESNESNLYIDHDTNRIIHQKDGRILDGSSLSVDSSHFDFLLPLGSTRETLELNLPGSYICISTAIFKTASISEIFDQNEFDNSFPPLTLTSKYKDVGGKTITKKFFIEIKYFTKSALANSPYNSKITKVRGRAYVKDI